MIWVLVMFLNRFFQQERFKRFRCTKFPSKLTLKCYANTSVKVDEQIVRGEVPTPISYLKGHSHPKLNCKKLGNQKLTMNKVSITRRTTLIMMKCGVRLENFYLSKLLCICPFRFEKTVSTKQNIAITRNSKECLASQVPVLRRNGSTVSTFSLALCLKNWWLNHFPCLMQLVVGTESCITRGVDSSEKAITSGNECKFSWDSKARRKTMAETSLTAYLKSLLFLEKGQSYGDSIPNNVSCMYTKPLQCKIRTSTQTQLHWYSIS